MPAGERRRVPGLAAQRLEARELAMLEPFNPRLFPPFRATGGTLFLYEPETDVWTFSSWDGTEAVIRGERRPCARATESGLDTSEISPNSACFGTGRPIALHLTGLGRIL